MINETHILELEHALIARAEALAAEYRARGEASRDRILREVHEKLRLREEREMLAAKALADRSYQQKVQAGELKLQGGLDRLRWTLVQGVMDSARERLNDLARDEGRYLPVLGALLARAAAGIEGAALVARVNRADHARLDARWKDFCEQWVKGREIALDPDPIDCIGGVLVQDAQARVRVDNSFDGRLERMQEELHQVILERLFAGLPESGAFFNG